MPSIVPPNPTTDHDVLILRAGPRSARGGLIWRGVGTSLALIGGVTVLGLLAAGAELPALIFWGGCAAILGLGGLGLRQIGRAPRQCLRIDPGAGRVSLRTWPLRGAPSEVGCALGSLEPPRVYLLPSAPDSSETPILEVTLAGGAWIASDEFATEEEARACAARIRAMIAAAR